jgi:hypothetical protein
MSFQRKERYAGKTEAPKTGAAGDGLYAIPFQFRDNTRDALIRIVVSAGSVGFRIAGDVADRTVFSPASTDVIPVDLSNVLAAKRDLEFYSRTTPTTVTFLEAHIEET